MVVLSTDVWKTREDGSMHRVFVWVLSCGCEIEALDHQFLMNRNREQLIEDAAEQHACPSAAPVARLTTGDPRLATRAQPPPA